MASPFLSGERTVSEQRALTDGRWLGDCLLNLVVILVLLFGNPQIQPFDPFEGQQMYFAEKLDNPCLVCVHLELHPQPS
jgi:hypothetical protein